MTRGQRLSFLAIAAVIAVVAVVVLASGSSDTGAKNAGAPTATPTAAATRAPSEASPQETATPKPPPLLTSARETALTFSEGETVRFRVRSSKPEEIHVHGYDRYVKVPAGKTVDVAFKADITGIFEVEFHNSGTLIAQLKVIP